MARLGRSYPLSLATKKPTASGPKSLSIDASLAVTATPVQTVSWSLKANASLAVVVPTATLPYTLPFPLGPQNVVGLAYGAAVTQSITATPTATVTMAAGIASSLALTATRTANAVYTASIAAILAETASLTATSTRAVFASTTLSSTATLTAAALFSPLVDTTLATTATLSATGTRTANVDSSLSVTATRSGVVSQNQVLTASVAVTATTTATASASLFAVGNLSVTATPSATSTRAVSIDSVTLALSASTNGFPFTFPLVFSPITVTATKGLIGNASLAITDTPSLTATRNQFVDALLSETATPTDAVSFAALLDAPQVITASRSIASTRNCPDDAALAGTASTSGDMIQGRVITPTPLVITVTNQTGATTSLLAAGNLSVTATRTATGSRVANTDSTTVDVTASVSASATIVASADAIQTQVTAAAPATSSRNANVSATTLTVTATPAAGVVWDAQGLSATLGVTVSLPAQEVEGALADVFAGAITASFPATATRNRFCNSTPVAITATPTATSTRNVGISASLSVTADLSATRSFLVDVDSDPLIITATPASSLTKGRIGYADLPVTVTLDSRAIYTQYLDAYTAATAATTGGFWQGVPDYADQPITASPVAIFTRNQFSESGTVSIEATVESAVQFGALADTSLPVTSSRSGDITRGHIAAASLAVTADSPGAVSFQASPDADLPVTATADVNNFLRDAGIDSELTITAQSSVVIYDDAEDEAQLYVTAAIHAIVGHSLFMDTDLSITATAESQEPTRGQFLDSEIMGIVTANTDPLYNQFLDSDMPLQVGHPGAVNWGALLNASMEAQSGTSIDYTRGMGLDALLEILGEADNRLRSDYIATGLPLNIVADDSPFAVTGRFVYAEQIVTAIPDDLLNIDAVIAALLSIPISASSDASDLLSSNFFPFYL